MFTKNIELLKDSVAKHEALMYMSTIRSMDRDAYTAYNLKRWNEIMEPFEKIGLWEPGKALGYDDRDPSA